ncbi:putative RNA methyltransferase [Salinimonas lutimaris]|uniref:putative RNA methyltransferase n=1 Tax=Salinimonas lutimaris TaxID=914153 RepID=UPI0010BF7F1D|nr:methyltransferase domain-containing protein [Salinimonas lutimaris]
MWQCPICQHSLSHESGPWQCANGHSFDQAKSGYVNLLPVQNKKSRQPGDDKAMLQARRQFHQSGGYAPLMETLAQLITTHSAAEAPLIYEAGCGEGAYLGYLHDALPQARFAGNDIAKAGVEMAAKKFRFGQFVVASSYSLPLMADSVDVMLQVFAPGDVQEYQRVLTAGGLLITVDPGPDHLCELKQQVYREPQQHKAPPSLAPPFNLAREMPLRFTVDLHDDERRAGLLAMTPYVWKLPVDGQQAIAASLRQVTAEFVIRVWQVQV